MQITLEPQTVELLQRASAVLNAGSYDEFIVRAVSDTLDNATRNATQQGTETSQELIDRFRRFRGALHGVTVDEVVAMRHEGLR